MSIDVRSIKIDPVLVPGAYNAINVCLRLRKEERITVIADVESLEIAASLIQQIEKVGSEYTLFVLEDYTVRPVHNMPKPILQDLAKSQVSIFACVAQTGELQSRIEMTAVVNQRRIRHAHMVNISRQIMMEGMRAD
ncbi:MAG TPA: aminopeptidase, partial [Bacteroidota bacterium]|nr:aminopeptidase [Bacteroidota bacterium]